MCGIVESIKERMGVGKRFVWLFSWLALLTMMDWIPTTRSRELSEAKRKDTLLGVNLEAS